MKKTIFVLTAMVFTVGATCGSPLQTYASQIPQLFTYEGKYVSPDGTPMPDGVYDLVFSLYEAQTNGSPGWTETHRRSDGNGVQVIQGKFKVALGKSIPLPNFSANYWLATIDPKSGKELVLREKLGSVPYAMTAESAYSLSASDGSPQKAVYVDEEGKVGIGTTSPLAKLTVNGPIIRRVAIATGLGPNDQTDNGQITSRVLNFTKLYEDTAIRILYCDNLRVNGTSAVVARWEIRVNGAAPPGGAIVQDKYGSSGNYHEPATILGYAIGLPAGDHQIQIWVGQSPGCPVCDAHTGYNNSRWTIEAQEVWIQ